MTGPEVADNDIVDAVAPLPVLGAGGIATGRQAAAAMALAPWGAAPLPAPWLAGGLALKIVALLALVALGLCVFALAAQLTGAARLGEMARIMRR